MNLLYGRVAMADDDMALLGQMVQGAKAHVEIGTLWGGSAIAALYANREMHVTCIDPFLGYYGEPDKWAGYDVPSLDKVRANLACHGMLDRVTLIQALSVPFPTYETFDTGLIDGDHAPEVVRADWGNLVKAGCKRIACHDMDDEDVAAVVEDAAQGWTIFGETKRMRVYTCE